MIIQPVLDYSRADASYREKDAPITSLPAPIYKRLVAFILANSISDLISLSCSCKHFYHLFSPAIDEYHRVQRENLWKTGEAKAASDLAKRELFKTLHGLAPNLAHLTKVAVTTSAAFAVNSPLMIVCKNAGLAQMFHSILPTAITICLTEYSLDEAQLQQLLQEKCNAELAHYPIQSREILLSWLAWSNSYSRENRAEHFERAKVLLMAAGSYRTGNTFINQLISYGALEERLGKQLLLELVDKETRRSISPPMTR